MSFCYGEILRRLGVGRENAERYDTVGFYYSPSNLGGCDRELYMQAKGLWSLAPGNRLLGIFRDGEAHEELTGSRLEKAGVRIVHAQKGCSLALPDNELIRSSRNIAGVSFHQCPVCGEALPSPCLHGHIDFVVQNPLTKRPEIIEHKAVNTHSWQATVERLTEQGGRGAWAHHTRYCVQLGLYLVSLSRQEGLPDAEGVLLMKDKNTAQFLDIRLRYEAPSDILRVVGAAVEGRSVMGEDGAFAVRGFMGHAVNKVMRIERAVRAPEERHMLRVPEAQCSSCAARTACRSEFHVPVEADTGETGLTVPATAEIASRMVEMKRLKDEIAALERRRDGIKSYLVSVLKTLAERENKAVSIVAAEEGLILSLRQWTRTDLDRTAYEALSAEEKAVVDKALKTTELQYPVVRRVPGPVKSPADTDPQ